jgi:hypothetical protein
LKILKTKDKNAENKFENYSDICKKFFSNY